MVEHNGNIVAIDHGASFTGHGMEGRSFIVRRDEIDSFLATSEGSAIIENLRSVNYYSFREEVAHYLGEQDAEYLLERIKFAIEYYDDHHRLDQLWDDVE